MICNEQIYQTGYKIITAYLCSNMSKISTIQDQEDRINPQFRGITQKYSKIKKERAEIDRRKHSLQNNLNYFERTKGSLDNKLKIKKQQLKWLKTIRERHITDLRYKMQKEEEENKKLEQLRLQSDKARKTAQANLSHAILNSRQEKLKTTQQVKRQLTEIKRLKEIQLREIQLMNSAKSKQIRQEKSLSKSKINHFFKRKNKILLNSYHEMIKNQQVNSLLSKEEISFIETQTNQIDQKIKGKKQKLKSIEDEIMRLRAEANDTRSINGQSMDYSRMTRRSSRPQQLLKQSYATQFPNIKNRQILITL